MGNSEACGRCNHPDSQHERRVSAASETGCAAEGCKCRGFHPGGQANARGEVLEKRPASDPLERR